MGSESNGVRLRPSAGMAAAARRGLELHEQGRSGDGLKPETVARARRIAARETLTESHVREMRAWFRRHKVDRRPGWSDSGKETPGYTAWMLWGGDPGWRWAEVKVSQMDRRSGLEERGRRVRKTKKRRMRPGRPVVKGASAGCGTGAGGFKAGNQCAKEDGRKTADRPMPPAQKKAILDKMAAKKAKVEAKQKAKQAVDKQTSIKAKKAKALVRKQQKDAKAAAEGQQAAAALDAKKAAMLQKIRINKANKHLTVSDYVKRPDHDVYDAAVKEMVDSVKRARKSPECQGTGAGLCSYIAEDVSQRLSERFKDRSHIEVLQHLPAGRDHASIVVVDHKSQTAVEIDIPESKYQRRTKSGKFLKIKNPNITDKDVELKDLDYKDFQRAAPARPAKAPGESEFDYQMRVNKDDFDAVRKGILDDHQRIVGAAVEARIAAAAALDASRTTRTSLFAKLTGADPGSKYFFTQENGKTVLRPADGARFKRGDKEFDDVEAAIRAEDDAVAVRDAAYARENASREEFRVAAWSRVGSLRDNAIDPQTSPAVMKPSDVESLNAFRSRGGFDKLSSHDTLYAPDSQVSADVSEAMRFYSAVGGAHLSKVVSAIKVAKIHGQKTAYAGRVISRNRNDYDFDDVSAITSPDDAIEAYSKVIAPARNAPPGPSANSPFIGLNGYVEKKEWVFDKNNKRSRKTVRHPAKDPDWMQEVAVHEIAHPIGQARSANQIANEFWKKRWDEHGRPDLKRYSSDKEREHQVTFDDRWYRTNYAGVSYQRLSTAEVSPGPTSPGYARENAGKFFDTELLTMGAQSLYRTPKEFLEHDPEHFFFTVGVLSGRFFRK